MPVSIPASGSWERLLPSARPTVRSCLWGGKQIPRGRDTMYLSPPLTTPTGTVYVCECVCMHWPGGVEIVLSLIMVNDFQSIPVWRSGLCSLV